LSEKDILKVKYKTDIDVCLFSKIIWTDEGTFSKIQFKLVSKD